MANDHVHPIFRSILDLWNPELGNRGDDLSAQAEDRAKIKGMEWTVTFYEETEEMDHRPTFDHSPSCETGPDKPEEIYREAEARQILAELEDEDAD